MKTRRQQLGIRARLAGFAFLLLILFVGIIPIIMDMQRMPSGKDPVRPAAIHSWPTWPAHLNGRGEETAPSALADLYDSMARFANRSAYPMEDVERTIVHVQTGQATGNDLFGIAGAARAGAEDERDALMGLVIPPELRGRPHLDDAWRAAQLASLAKVKALKILETHATEPHPWESPAYLAALEDASAETRLALADIARASDRHLLNHRDTENTEAAQRKSKRL